MPIRAFATYGNTQVKIKSLSPIFKRQLAVMVFLIISILPITAQETNQTSKEKQKVESSRLPFMMSFSIGSNFNTGEVIMLNGLAHGRMLPRSLTGE